RSARTGRRPSPPRTSPRRPRCPRPWWPSPRWSRSRWDRSRTPPTWPCRRSLRSRRGRRPRGRATAGAIQPTRARIAMRGSSDAWSLEASVRARTRAEEARRPRPSDRRRRRLFRAVQPGWATRLPGASPPGRAQSVRARGARARPLPSAGLAPRLPVRSRARTDRRVDTGTVVLHPLQRRAAAACTVVRIQADRRARRGLVDLHALGAARGEVRIVVAAVEPALAGRLELEARAGLLRG